METTNEAVSLGLVPRAVALGLAFATTTLITTGTAILFAGTGQGFADRVVSVAIAPLKAIFGG